MAVVRDEVLNLDKEQLRRVRSTEKVTKQSEPSYADPEAFCKKYFNVRRKPFRIINSETWVFIASFFL